MAPAKAGTTGVSLNDGGSCEEVLGFGIVLLLPDPPLLLLGIAVMTAILPYAILRNYGMFSTFLTPLVLLPSSSPRQAAGRRAGRRRGPSAER